MPSGSCRGREVRSGAHAPAARRDAPECADARMASLPAAVPMDVPMAARADVQAVSRLVGRQAGQTAGREGVRPAPARPAAVRPSHGSGSGPARPRSGGLGPPAGRADQ
jgi:hypothetical protein